MPKLWRAPIPMVRITAPQITGIQKLCCCGLPAASDGGINRSSSVFVNLGAGVNEAQSGRSFRRRGRTNLYFAAILEVDGRSEHHLVALLDALADLDLGSEVANFGDLAAVHDAVLDHEHVEAVAVEDDRPRRHDQRRRPARDL